MKRRAQLGGAQRRGSASEAEEDIPPARSRWGGLRGRRMRSGGGGKEADEPKHARLLGRPSDDAAQKETATIPEPADHDVLTTPSNARSLQNALSTHHTQYPRPRRQVQPYLAEETDTDARRRGAAGRNAHGGARAERPRHHAPADHGRPGGAEGAEARGATGAGGARTTARGSTRTAGATAQRAGGARREPQPTEDAGARPHRRPNAGRTTATPAPAEGRPCAGGGRAGAARRAPRGRTAGRGGQPAPPPPRGRGEGRGAESLGGGAGGACGRRARGASGATRGTRRPSANEETFVSRLPNLLRYGRGLVASNLGAAEITTVILYGSKSTVDHKVTITWSPCMSTFITITSRRR